MGHGMPVVGGGVVLALVRCIGTEQVRGDVDHSGGEFAVVVRVSGEAVVGVKGGKSWNVQRRRQHRTEAWMQNRTKGIADDGAKAKGQEWAERSDEGRDGAQDGPEGDGRMLSALGSWPRDARRRT